MMTEKEEYVFNLIKGHNSLYGGSPVYVKVLLAYIQSAAYSQKDLQAGNSPFARSEVFYELHPILASLEDAGKVELTATGVRLKA